MNTKKTRAICDAAFDVKAARELARQRWNAGLMVSEQLLSSCDRIEALEADIALIIATWSADDNSENMKALLADLAALLPDSKEGV